MALPSAPLSASSSSDRQELQKTITKCYQKGITSRQMIEALKAIDTEASYQKIKEGILARHATHRSRREELDEENTFQRGVFKYYLALESIKVSPNKDDGTFRIVAEASKVDASFLKRLYHDLTEDEKKPSIPEVPRLRRARSGGPSVHTQPSGSRGSALIPQPPNTPRRRSARPFAFPVPAPTPRPSMDNT
jgi:hypothetical protein